MIEPIVYTERDLYAIIGELFVQGQMKDIDIARLRAELALLTVVESPEEEDGDAVGES